MNRDCFAGVVPRFIKTVSVSLTDFAVLIIYQFVFSLNEFFCLFIMTVVCRGYYKISRNVCSERSNDNPDQHTRLSITVSTFEASVERAPSSSGEVIPASLRAAASIFHRLALTKPCIWRMHHHNFQAILAENRRLRSAQGSSLYNRKALRIYDSGIASGVRPQ